MAKKKETLPEPKPAPKKRKAFQPTSAFAPIKHEEPAPKRRKKVAVEEPVLPQGDPMQLEMLRVLRQIQAGMSDQAMQPPPAKSFLDDDETEDDGESWAKVTRKRPVSDSPHNREWRNPEVIASKIGHLESFRDWAHPILKKLARKMGME